MAVPKLTLQCTFEKVVQELNITPVPQTPTDVHFYDRFTSVLTGMQAPKQPSRPFIPRGTFEILALPAELRNHIYKHALTHDVANGQFPNTALLQTCKQINDECFLLPEKHGVVRLDIAINSLGKLSVDGNVVGGQRTFGMVSPLIDLAGVWPPHLHRLPTVIINIEINDSLDKDTPSDVYRSTFAAVNALLFSLACHLKSQGPLSSKVAGFFKRSMTININSACLLDESRAKVSEELFYPLAKMPLSYDMKITEKSLLASVEDSLVALREQYNCLGSTTAPEVYFNLMQQWCSKYDDFTNALNLEADGQPKPPGFRLFLSQPVRSLLLSALRTFGRGIFPVLQLATEKGAMVFSQRAENRLYGMLVTLEHITRTIDRQQHFTREQIDGRYDEAHEMYTEMVLNKPRF